jgi:hypothetical protein
MITVEEIIKYLEIQRELMLKEQLDPGLKNSAYYDAVIKLCLSENDRLLKFIKEE